MKLDDPDPIIIQVTIPLPIPMIFAAFADADVLDGWLCDSAHVEPVEGGRYELTWNEPTPHTSHGTVTKITRDVDLGFTWQAPPPYAELLNAPTPRTTVYVRLQESPEGIDVTLEHDGWQLGDAWDDARSHHFHFWDERLHRLKDHLLQVAYG